MLIYCLNSSVLPLGMMMLVTPRLVPTLGMMMLVVTPRLAPPDRYIPCGRRDAHRAIEYVLDQKTQIYDEAK